MKLDEIKKETEKFIGICEKAGRYYDVAQCIVERDESQGPQVIVLHQAVVLHAKETPKQMSQPEDIETNVTFDGSTYAVDVRGPEDLPAESGTEDVD